MPAILLVLAGAAVCVGAVVLARRTRQHPEAGPAGTDPWAALAPRSIEDIEREGRVRLWPVAAFLAGLVLIAGGLVVSRLGDRSGVRASRPFLIEVSPSAEPTPEPTPERTVEPAVDATPVPSPGPSSSARPTPTATTRATPARTATPRPPTPRVTPTPTPPPVPGPNVGASTSCFSQQDGTTARISYQINAQTNTTLRSLSVGIDGKAAQKPSVSGRTSYSGSYETQVGSGSHTFTVSATGSDGGVSNRSFPACP